MQPWAVAEAGLRNAAVILGLFTAAASLYWLWRELGFAASAARLVGWTAGRPRGECSSGASRTCTLVNALHVAAKNRRYGGATSRLTPETTAGSRGLRPHLRDERHAAAANLKFILRDFELDGLRDHGELLQQVCAALQAAEPRAQITCTITKQDRKMGYWLEKDMRPVDLAREACRRLGITTISTPTRGGTDGSRLTEMGVPTPNLFTGMQKHPWTAGVGQRSGHGSRHRDVYRAGAAVEQRDTAGRLERRRRIYAGRSRARRVCLRDVLGGQGGRARAGRVDSSRPGEGQAESLTRARPVSSKAGP